MTNMTTRYNTHFSLSPTNKVFELPDDDLSSFIRYCLDSCDISMDREVSPIERFIIMEILNVFHDFYIPLHRNHYAFDRKEFIQSNYINLDDMKKYDGENIDDESDSFSYLSNLMRDIIDTKDDFCKLKILDKIMKTPESIYFTNGYKSIISEKTMMLSSQDPVDEDDVDFSFSDTYNIGIIQNSNNEILYTSDYLITEMSFDAEDHPIGILVIQ